MKYRIQILLIVGVFLMAMAAGAQVAQLSSQQEVQFSANRISGAGLAPFSRIGNGAPEIRRERSGDREVLIHARRYSAIATAGGIVLHPLGGDRQLPHSPVSFRWSSRASTPKVSGTSVQFSSALPNIDVVYHEADGDLEYDFVVHPGGDPDAIRIEVEGTASPRMLESGDLEIATPYGSFLKRKPFAYQLVNGTARRVPVSYRLTPSGEITFDLGDFNAALPLVIDPVITYSATFGNGSPQSGLHSVAKAPDGTMIYFGTSFSDSRFPSLPGETTPRTSLFPNLNFSSHLTRFRGDFGSVMKTARLGFANVNYQAPRLLAVGRDGDVVTVHGYTDSFSTKDPLALSTTGPYGVNIPLDPNRGHLRVAIVKARADLETVAYATVIRCTGDLRAQAIAIASNGDLVLAGSTTCPDLPISPGAFSQPPSDTESRIFLMRLSGDGKVLKYSTAFGGSAFVEVSGLAIREDGAYVITGSTNGESFPTTAGALRASGRNIEGFVSILAGDGSTVVASTFIGGAANDRIVAMAIAPGGDIVVTLSESSTDLAVTPGAFRPTALSGGAVARIAPDLSSYRFLSYAPGALALSDLAVDEAGDVWILSGFYPGQSDQSGLLPPPLAEESPGMNTLLYKVKGDGTALLFSTPWFGHGFPGRFAAVRPGGADILINGSGNHAYPARGPAFSTGKPGSNIYDVYIASVDIADPTRCQLSVPSPDVSIGHRGGSGVFTVLAPDGCPWMAFDDRQSSVLPSPAVSGFGNGQIPYTVPVNRLSYRSLTYELRVNATPLILRQAAADCADWSITPEFLEFGAAGGVRTATMTIPAGCVVWHAPGASWISTTLAPTPFGVEGSVTFSAAVSANMFQPRATTLKIMGRDVPVTQAGGSCSATVAPSLTALPIDGGIVTLRIATSNSNCSWFASGNPDLFRYLDPANGIGTRDLRMEVYANKTNRSRLISLFVAGKTVTLEQAAGSCRVLSEIPWIDVEKGGGPFYGVVSSEGSQCEPQPTSEAEWIQPVPPSTVYPGQFGFYAIPNGTGARRRAQLSVLGKSVTVQQFAGPTTKVFVNAGGGPLPYIIDGEPRTLNGSFLAETGVAFTIEAPAIFVDNLERLHVFNQWTPSATDRRLTLTPQGEYLSLVVNSTIYFPFLMNLQGNPASGGGSVIRTGGATPFYSTPTADYYYADQTVSFTALDGPKARFLRYEGALNSFERTINVSTNSYQPLIAVFEAVASPAFALSKPSLSLVRFPSGTSGSDSLQISSVSGSALTLGNPETSCPAPIPSGAVFASLSTGMTPITLSAQAAASRLEPVPPGVYTCTVLLRATGQTPSITIPLTLTVESFDPGVHRIAAVVEGAAFRAVPIAPGSIATIFGTDLAVSVARPQTLPLPTEMAGTKFVFRSGNSSMPAGLFYVSRNQVNLLVPDALPPGSAILEFYRDGVLTDSREIAVAASAPSLFTANSDGKGAPSGFAVRAKGQSQERVDLYRCDNGPGSCIPASVSFEGESQWMYLELFGTGFRHAAARPRATIGGSQVDVEFVGPHSQFAGLDQINLKVPRWLFGNGLMDLVIEVDGLSTNRVQVRF